MTDWETTQPIYTHQITCEICYNFIIVNARDNNHKLDDWILIEWGWGVCPKCQKKNKKSTT